MSDQVEIPDDQDFNHVCVHCGARKRFSKGFLLMQNKECPPKQVVCMCGKTTPYLDAYECVFTRDKLRAEDAKIEQEKQDLKRRYGFDNFWSWHPAMTWAETKWRIDAEYGDRMVPVWDRVHMGDTAEDEFFWRSRLLERYGWKQEKRKPAPPPEGLEVEVGDLSKLANVTVRFKED